MIMDYQTKKSLEDERAAPAAAQLHILADNFLNIIAADDFLNVFLGNHKRGGTVYSDGISLIFDGDSEPTAKHYKCNAALTFAAGQRVKIVKISGTYVVEYPIGNPKQ